MKKTIRILAVVLCLVLAVSALSGCTIKLNITVNQQGGSSASSATPVASPSQTPAPTPAPSASESTTAAPASSAAPANSGEAKPSGDTKQEASAGKELSPTSPKEDIVAEYVKVYNTTKKAGTFKGHDEMTLVEVLIDGKDNSMIKNAAKGMVKAEGTDMPLPPYSDDNPCNECLTTAADIATATYTDNGDGTATIKLVPIATTNSKKFSDAQGNMFNVMEDVKPTVESIPILKWSEGTTDDNVVLKCDGGYAEVTYDKATKMMTKADYTLITIAEVQHANILIFKDKSATAKFDYKMLYPG